GELSQPGQLLPRAHDLGRTTADRLGLPDAGDRGGGRVPVAHPTVAVQQDDAVADVGERERRLGPALGFAVQARVLDRYRSARGNLLRELELGILELPRLCDERECAEGAIARAERQRDR